MNDYRSFIDNFDPRETEGSDLSVHGTDGGYVPRHPKKGLSSSGEYRPKHPINEETSYRSPSPVKEGGDDDFTVFNFDEARRRRLAREEELNARMRREEAPRELVRNIADNAPPAIRTPRQRPARPDSQTRRASDFVRKLSGYAVSDAEEEYARPVRSAGAARQPARNTASGASSAERRSPAPSKKNAGASADSKPGGWFAGLSVPVKTLLAAGCVFLVLLIIYYSTFGALLSGMNSLELERRQDIPASETVGLELMSSSRVTNILLLGIDDDGSSGSRSDTIMIASLDSRSNTIRLCSVLRDCYVEIPGHGSNRINAAYAYGGAQLAVHTVESNFRIEIDHCVAIDMAALVDVVDAIGGVEIELTAAEANQVNLHSHCGLTTAEGKQLLNGKQAVTYAQIRKIDSDFMRTQRQRTLINAILIKLRSLSLSELMGVVKAVSPNITTDMSSAQIASLAFKALPALTNELGQITIPADGNYSSTTINGMSVLRLDMKANARLLQEYLYND